MQRWLGLRLGPFFLLGGTWEQGTAPPSCGTWSDEAVPHRVKTGSDLVPQVSRKLLSSDSAGDALKSPRQSVFKPVFVANCSLLFRLTIYSIDVG